MAQYCGCKTVENRVKWGAFAVLLLLAVIFSTLYITSLVNALKGLMDCEQASEYTENYTVDDQKCLDDYVSAWAAIYTYMVLAIVCFITCTIPLYVMCCCTEPPSNGHTLNSMYELHSPHQTAYTAVPVDQQTNNSAADYSMKPLGNNKFDII